MDAVEEVKSHLDIVDIAGEYFQLKPAGTGSFKTCCPFHQEKTPSFFVNRSRQSWHCFGCDKGGDLISLVMEMEGMEFKEALAHLAQKAGIQLPNFDTRAAGERKRLQEINEMAARFFRAQLLQSPQAEHARIYADERGIDDLTGDLFKIGYAPDSWDALTKALKAKDVTEDELLRAGLVGKSQRGQGVYDRFRDRLMFSIQDVHGNVVGFTGRLLNKDAKEAKYVNSPETPVYKKSNVLYGLDKAKGEIKSKDLCVIVEGNMDVVSSHRVNVTNVVASSGTALTAEQLKLISRFTKNLAIAFDADAAGGEATLRGLDLARAQDFNIKIITIPDEAGKDPDEAIQQDPRMWTDAINNAEDIMDWIFHAAFQRESISRPEDKRAIAAKILPEIKRIVDPIVRDHWIKKLAEALRVGEEALRDALRNQQPERAKNEREEPPEAITAPSQPNRLEDLLERLFCLILKRPTLIEHAPEDFEKQLPERFCPLYIRLKQAYNADRSDELNTPEDNKSPEPTIKDLIDYLAIRADRDYPNQTSDALASEFATNLAAYLRLKTQEERKRLEEEMRAAELAGDEESIVRIAQRFRELM